jgi:hypothetical protein
MSDMSSLSHEYASVADFSRVLNEAVLLLKKRFAHAERYTETEDLRSVVHRLRDILTTILRRLIDADETSSEQGEVVIPEDVLTRMIEEHRGELAYFREDIARLVAALAANARLERQDFDILDALCEAADASASATFRKLWRR